MPLAIATTRGQRKEMSLSGVRLAGAVGTEEPGHAARLAAEAHVADAGGASLILGLTGNDNLLHGLQGYA